MAFAEGTYFLRSGLRGRHILSHGNGQSLSAPRDELLIERQLRCLRDAGAAQLLISGRAEVDYSHFGQIVVHDEYSDAGPLSGLTAILKAAAFERTLILAIDMPAMTAAMLRNIVSRCGDKLGCVPIIDRGFEPFAAVYSKQHLPLAEELLAEGRHSMREFVKEGISRGMTLSLPVEPAERIYFMNCNRPSDWADFCGSAETVSPNRRAPRRED